MRPFNTGDCLIEVTAWTGLTIYTIELNKNDMKFPLFSMAI
jgi:hypothetical protein